MVNSEWKRRRIIQGEPKANRHQSSFFFSNLQCSSVKRQTDNPQAPIIKHQASKSNPNLQSSMIAVADRR
jgi:hypothetical protein